MFTSASLCNEVLGAWVLEVLENLVLESNKYAAEKTGSYPNFAKAQLLTYIGLLDEHCSIS